MSAIQPQREHKLVLYSPHDLQKNLHDSKARYRVAAFGRQSGKSTWAGNEILKKMWERPRTRYWFVSPTFDQAKVHYRRAVATLWACRSILVKKNQSELRIKLINGSECRWVSGESYQNLRGETLHGAILDEVRDLPNDLWPMLIRPMLSTTQGWAAFVSTPNGFDTFYDLFERTQSGLNPNWEGFQAPSTCSPYFTQAEFEAAKAEMPEAMFDQEIMANFRDLTAGKAYMSFGPHNLTDSNPFTNVVTPLPHPSLPIVVAMDFNLSPMAWTLGQQKIRDFYWFSEIWLKNSHTQEAALELVQRVRGHKPGVVLCGDATAKAGQRAAAGKSDYDIIKVALTEAGIPWTDKTPDSNPRVKDRINTMNAALKDASGISHVHILRSGCPMLIRDLQRTVWKPGVDATLDQTSNRDLTHASDGIGYAHSVLSPLASPSSEIGLRIIRR